MDDSGSYGETLEGATSCRSCQTCTTTTQILRTSSETGFFENRDSVISWRSVIGQLIQAGDPDWVIEDWMPDNDFWIRYIEWETLSYRAAVGCPTCRVIQDGILVFLSDDDFQGEGRPRLEVNVWCIPEEAPLVSMSVPRMKLHLGRYTLHLHRNPRTNAFLWPLPSIPAHLQKESRDDKISNIKLWMKECSESMLIAIPRRWVQWAWTCYCQSEWLTSHLPPAPAKMYVSTSPVMARSGPTSASATAGGISSRFRRPERACRHGKPTSPGPKFPRRNLRHPPPGVSLSPDRQPLHCSGRQAGLGGASTAHVVHLQQRDADARRHEMRRL